MRSLLRACFDFVWPILTVGLAVLLFSVGGMLTAHSIAAFLEKL